jgi:hypothetical protein
MNWINPIAMPQETEDIIPLPITPNPMVQAIAWIRAKGSTYPFKIWAVFGSSAAMTNHSVFGVMMMFLALSTMSMVLTPERVWMERILC